MLSESNQWSSIHGKQSTSTLNFKIRACVSYGKIDHGRNACRHKNKISNFCKKKKKRINPGNNGIKQEQSEPERFNKIEKKST